MKDSLKGLLLVSITGGLMWMAWQHPNIVKPKPYTPPSTPLNDLVTWSPPAGPKTIHGPFDTLKVGPFVYKVIWVDGLFQCGVATATGCTQYSTLEIQITKGTPGYTRATVLHELMHAVAALYQNPFQPSELSGEEWAQTSPVFLEVLRDNPKLVKYLTETE